jgi:hypothetical protein
MRSVKKGLIRFLLFEIRIEKPGQLIVKGSKSLRRFALRISVVPFVKSAGRFSEIEQTRRMSIG